MERQIFHVEDIKVTNCYRLSLLSSFPDFVLYLLTACDCHLPGTEHGNNTLCDQITGQCVCNATLNIGGRRCDMCKENSWNASAGRFGCEGAICCKIFWDSVCDVV